MGSTLQIGKREDFSKSDIIEMYKLRARVFKGRLGWEVPLLTDMEVDGYDAFDPYYIIVKGSANNVVGCWRLMPTTGPYMLKDTFPQLLCGAAAPQDETIWELSRFAVESESHEKFGFSELVLDAMRLIYEFAQTHNITQYLTVTTVPMERLLKKTGLPMVRVGDSMRIGIESAVALSFKTDSAAHAALYRNIQQPS